MENWNEARRELEQAGCSKLELEIHKLMWKYVCTNGDLSIDSVVGSVMGAVVHQFALLHERLDELSYELPEDCDPDPSLVWFRRKALELFDKRTEEVLKAQTQSEVDTAFEKIFDEIHYTVDDNDPTYADGVLVWLRRDDVLTRCHPELLVSALRLTYNIRRSLVEWDQTFKEVKATLRKRFPDEAEQMLVGLK